MPFHEPGGNPPPRTVVQINIAKEAIEEHVRELVAPSLEAAADLADAVFAALAAASGARTWPQGSTVLDPEHAEAVTEAAERYRATAADLVGGPS